MSDKIICHCKKVSEATIVEAVKKGADTLEKVMEETKAGTGCGRCKDTVQAIVNENK